MLKVIDSKEKKIQCHRLQRSGRRRHQLEPQHGEDLRLLRRRSTRQFLRRVDPPERLDEEREILERIRHNEHVKGFETMRLCKNDRWVKSESYPMQLIWHDFRSVILRCFGPVRPSSLATMRGEYALEGSEGSMPPCWAGFKCDRSRSTDGSPWVRQDDRSLRPQER
jgi:hypothetical protein